jgi:hypothetical protein
MVGNGLAQLVLLRPALGYRFLVLQQTLLADGVGLGGGCGSGGTCQPSIFCITVVEGRQLVLCMCRTWQQQRKNRGRTV